MNPLARVYVCLQQSRVLEAEQLLMPLLRDFPREPAVHRAHAALAHSKGQMDAAIAAMQAAVMLAPADAVLHLELGQALGAAGQVEPAAVEFRSATELQPDLLGAWYLLGMTLYGQRREAEALPSLQRAHQLAPTDLHILRVLAETEYTLELYAQALAHYERIAASGEANDYLVPVRRSQCTRRLGEPLRALDLVREGLKQFPHEAPLWLELGWVHEDLADAAQAQEAYSRAHALRPDWADPLGSAIALARAAAPEDLVRKAEAMAADSAVPPEQRAFLHHVLGKRDDAGGNYASAAAHWIAANRMRRAVDGSFDRAEYTHKLDAAIATFTPELLRACHADALQDERPIFIVGMPRSGTTLTEQILAAHPSVQGCGERTAIVEIASGVQAETGLRWPQDAARLDGDWRRSKAQAYLDAIGGSATTALRVVDKQPYNFLHVGLLAMLFANARIVWCQRDPRDIALSIFSESFAPASTFATDLDDIRFVIEGQERLMRHWQSVSPLPILEMPYEAVVADVEGHAGRLIEFAGLPWDDACLAFHDSKRPVQTLSRWQVRQPVHNRSVGRWRNYPQWFAE
jgi:tetratricopeptide (TPR) repeat protein